MPDAVDIAIQTELDGRKMYEDSARRASNPLARSMFDSLVQDEIRHLQILKEVFGRDVPVEQDTPSGPEVHDVKTSVQTIFSLAGRRLDDKIVATADDLEAIRVAMEFERKGHLFYQEHARKTMNKEEKKIFQHLAHWESEHMAVLQNIMIYFEDPESWYAWQEQHLSDGG